MIDRPTQQDKSMPLEASKESGDEKSVYYYETAGIREHRGSIPTWLVLVAIGLIVWGIYYTIRFWSSG
jgi:hypothetical protein